MRNSPSRDRTYGLSIKVLLSANLVPIFPDGHEYCNSNQDGKKGIEREQNKMATRATNPESGWKALDG